jgi:hypothetical protein
VNARRERGQAGIEVLIVLLILIPLILGAFSLSQGLSARHALDQATAVAARRIAVQPAAWHEALAGVQGAVDGSLLGGTGGLVACQVEDAGGQEIDPETLAFGTPFVVSCDVPYQARIPWMATALRGLSVTHYEMMERYP